MLKFLLVWKMKTVITSQGEISRITMQQTIADFLACELELGSTL